MKKLFIGTLVLLVAAGCARNRFDYIDIAASEKSGAQWLIVEQDQPDKGNTELSAVKQSIEYLRSL